MVYEQRPRAQYFFLYQPSSVLSKPKRFDKTGEERKERLSRPHHQNPRAKSSFPSPQSVTFVSFGAMAPNADESVKLFLSIGLDEKTATTTINNPKVTANLTAIIYEVSFLISPPSSPVSSLSSFSPPLLTESKFYKLNSKFLV